jgi:hypothetical protein
MAERRLRLLPKEPPNSSLVASSYMPLVASAGMGTDTGAYGQGTQPWQEQAWSYWRNNGQLHQAVEWFSNSLSQLQLVAAEAQSDEEEPVPLESGPAVDIVAQLAWDSSSILRDLTVYKFVPGRGYLVGRQLGSEIIWCAYSADQVRLSPSVERIRKNKPDVQPEYEIQEDNKRWVSAAGALVVPVRTPDPQFKWADTSPLQSQLGVLREIDLYDREIVSSLVSRIANNGILFVPSEATFPSRPEFNDGRDPFVLQLIETAQQSIKDPGSASAALPQVIRVPAGLIEKFHHLVIAAGVDEKVLLAREKAIGILADGLPMPRENVVGGMADVNHWSGWLLEESAIKTYISPFAGEICRDLTRGFLWPQLAANGKEIRGPNGGRLVVWFDAAKLAAKPDKSANATAAFEADVMNIPAYMRELGFSESDIPTNDQLFVQLLLKAAKQPVNAFTAIEALTGKTIVDTPTQEEADPEDTGDVPPEDELPVDDTMPERAEDAPRGPGEG